MDHSDSQNWLGSGRCVNTKPATRAKAPKPAAPTNAEDVFSSEDLESTSILGSIAQTLDLPSWSTDTPRSVVLASSSAIWRGLALRPTKALFCGADRRRWRHRSCHVGRSKHTYDVTGIGRILQKTSLQDDDSTFTRADSPVKASTPLMAPTRATDTITARRVMFLWYVRELTAVALERRQCGRKCRGEAIILLTLKVTIERDLEFGTWSHFTTRIAIHVTSSAVLTKLGLSSGVGMCKRRTKSDVVTYTK